MSDKPKWTPGPWRWNMDSDGVGTLYGGELIAPKAMADFWRKPLREVPQDTRFESELKAEQIANLDLCAAAPDLYRALAVMAKHHQASPHIGIARAALAKAEGRS